MPLLAQLLFLMELTDFFPVESLTVFVYSANHDVLEVNEPDFSSCSASNPIEKHTDGNTAITLLTSGKRFFICGVPGHCLAGMKVEIDTLATPSPPPSSMAMPPSPPPEVTPSSPPPTSSPAVPTSPPASPPKAATKPPAKSPLAPPPDSNASPPAPPTEPTPPPSAPESPIPPFPFDQPLVPSAAPKPPPPPPSSAYKCSFRLYLSVGFTFVVIMLLFI